MATSALVLTYFEIPGRGETARLMFTLGGKEFEDKRITFQTWGSGDLKAQLPFGQVPVLYVDGECLAQSAAIDRYAAKVTGMLPEDPWTAALADQAYNCAEDVWMTVAPTMQIKDPEEQVKARQELVAGALGLRLKQLSNVVETKPGKFISGDKLTHGDLRIFVTLGMLQSGFLQGIPTDLLDSYPVLKEFRNSIATLPEIAAFYSKETDDIRAKGFKADSA